MHAVVTEMRFHFIVECILPLSSLKTYSVLISHTGTHTHAHIHTHTHTHTHTHPPQLNESRMIKHYQYGDWSEDQAPVNAAGIIDLIGVLQKTQHMGGGGPIVVHDRYDVIWHMSKCRKH